MDYNHLFIQGQEVSSFIKNSNKIWEGIIVDRSDGTKVVLNEETKAWKRLSDLEHIKRVGKLLYEDSHQEEATDLIKDFNSFTQSTLSKGNEKDLEDVAKNPSSKEQLSNHLITISKANPDIKDTPSSPDEAMKTVDENIADVLANKKAEQAPGNDAAIKAAQEETEKIIGKQVQETISRLHPIIKNKLYEMSAKTFHHCREFFNQTHDKKKTAAMLKLYGMSKESANKTVDQWEKIAMEIGAVLNSLHEDVDEDDLIDFMRDQCEHGDFEKKDFEKVKDYLKNEDDGAENKTKADEKESLNYENEDYLDIPDDVKEKVIKKVKDLLADNEDDIEEVIKSSFELTDDDAEEFIMQAFEEYLEESDVEPRDSIANYEDDEVEKDFENTIDEFEGPNEELLDHLVDEYEIDGSEAEKIYDEKQGNLEECIYAFVDIVKNRLKEMGPFGKKNLNFEDWDKEKIEEWINTIRYAPNPGNSYALPVGTEYYNSNLVPQGKPAPATVIRKLADYNIPIADIQDVVTKIYPGFSKENVFELIRLCER
jgi:hypothetical protein